MKRDLEDGYVPLDEWLARPRTRLLRALRWFDWVSFDDLMLACNASDHESQSFTKAMSRAVQAGEIERRGSKQSFQYKLVIAAQPPTLVTTRAKRSYIADRRKRLADAGMCRNSSLTGNGVVVHGEPVMGGRCARCFEVQREAAKKREQPIVGDAFVWRGKRRAA